MSRERNKDAVDGVASDIAKNIEPALAAAINGGKRHVDSETAHRVAAAIARDSDKGPGALRDISDYMREARKR